jgi:type IV secretion system protein VirB3
MTNQVNVDSVFLGLTRPPLLFGVSYNYFILNIMICMGIYINTSNFLYFAMMGPIHFLGYYLCSKEPRFIELFMNRNQNCPRIWNFTFHKGNSYDPF